MIKKLLSYLKPKCQFEAFILKNKPQTISEVENLMRIYTQTKFNQEYHAINQKLF